MLMLLSPTIGCADITRSGGVRKPSQTLSDGGCGMLITNVPEHFLSSTFNLRSVLETPREKIEQKLKTLNIV